MKLKTFNSNEMGQNTYLYFDENTGEGVIIDAGCSEADAASLSQFMSENNIKVKALLLTHGHFDHIIAAKEIASLACANVCCHEAEAEMLKKPDINRSSLNGKAVSVTPDVCFDDGYSINLGDAKLKVLHTPGHTPGGVCYYDEVHNNLFTGDTLFKESVGRTDLPAGNQDELFKNIKEKLFTLPDRTNVYPGHGPSTLVSHEKQHNPFVRL